VLQRAMQTGRCTSPRTLYELSRLHGVAPAHVAALVEGDQPITREAVAALRKARPAAKAPGGPARRASKRPLPAAKLLGRAVVLSRQLDAVLLRLSQAEAGALGAEKLAALRQRIAALAGRLDP
jgi:ParB family chromosome partitioning protein